MKYFDSVFIIISHPILQYINDPCLIKSHVLKLNYYAQLIWTKLVALSVHI